MKFFNYCSVVAGGALLVTGTCIGAGMLGLPVSTAAAGFYPTLFSFLLIWALMTFTALAFLEVALLLEGECNLISLAQMTLGMGGKQIAWLTYLLFLYSVMAAYTAGGATILSQVFSIDIHSLDKLIYISFGFTLPFAAMIYRGTKVVDYVNRLLILGLVVSFSSMCALVSDNINLSLDNASNTKFLAYTFPLIVLSFGYHLLIPTLKTYLKSNVRQLRLAIVVGGFIPFIIYVIWEYIVLSLVPTWGEGGLVQMLNGDGNPADLLIKALSQKDPGLSQWVAYFSFFALASSFVGVALSIYDFFADGLKIKKTPRGKISLLMLTFVPPVIYTIIYPKGFLLALSYAGIFASILLIIYPIIMAWSSRYYTKLSDVNNYRVIGGKVGLLLAFLGGAMVIIFEILSQFDMLPMP